jgi:hypothetical protein
MEALGMRRGIAPTLSYPRHQKGVSDQYHVPAALYPRERAPGTHCTGGWVVPRAGLDAEVRGKNPLPLSGIQPHLPGSALSVRSFTISALVFAFCNLFNQFSIFLCFGKNSYSSTLF